MLAHESYSSRAIMDVVLNGEPILSDRVLRTAVGRRCHRKKTVEEKSPEGISGVLVVQGPRRRVGRSCEEGRSEGGRI